MERAEFTMTELPKIEPATMESVGLTTEENPAAARTLTLGIVGSGDIVSRIHLPALTACEHIRVVYVADRNSEAAKSLARSYNVAPVLVNDDPNNLPLTDLALLAVPVTARAPYYRLFAERGTCVLAEKPLAVGRSEAEQVCALYPDYALACGFQRRSFASVELARSVVAENWFGPLRSISISEGALTTKTGTDSRFYDDAERGGGGVLMDLGCHSLDMAIYITDAAEAIPVEQHFVFDRGVDRQLEARLTLRGAHRSYELDYFVTWLCPAKNTVELCFENCTVELSCQPSRDLKIRGAGNAPDIATLAMKQSGAATVYQAFFLEWEAFLDGMRSRRPSKFSARSCLPTIRAVEDLYRAGKRSS
jgi:predicted dehydrogenase